MFVTEQRTLHPLYIFRLYTAISLHFWSSYDAVKYNFKTRQNGNKLEHHPVSKIFSLLAHKFYDAEEYKEFLLANFWWHHKQGQRLHPRVLLDDVSMERHMAWKQRQENFLYLFEQEMYIFAQHCQRQYRTLSEAFYIDRDLPLVVKLWMQEKISDESYLMLDRFLKFLSHHRLVASQHHDIYEHMLIGLQKYDTLLTAISPSFMPATIPLVKAKAICRRILIEENSLAEPHK